MVRTFAVHALLSILLCLFLTAPCASAPKVAKEWTLPTFEGSPYGARITGDWVVACQLENPKNNSTSQAINAYNVVTGEVRTAFEGGSLWPQVGGNFAVWTAGKKAIQAFFQQMGDADPSRGKSNMVILDLVNWRYYTPGLCSGSANHTAVGGNRVAWNPPGYGEICYMQIGGAKQWRIPTGSQNYMPCISDALAVWVEGKNGQHIRGYDFRTSEEFYVTTNTAGKHTHPHTDGRTVVWEVMPKTVWAYDVKTGKSGQIANGERPWVDGDIVVYSKRIDGRWVVFGTVLSTKEEFRISSGPSNSEPSISGNRVVWSNDNKIYCAELDFKNR